MILLGNYVSSFEHRASSNKTDQEALKYRALTIKNATSGDKESAIEKGHKLLLYCHRIILIIVCEKV